MQVNSSLTIEFNLLKTATVRLPNVKVTAMSKFHICYVPFFFCPADFGVARVLERTSVAKSFCGRYYQGLGTTVCRQ